MIIIHYKNGYEEDVPKEDFDNYTYDGKVFMIFKEGHILAIINIDSVSGIFIKK